MSLTSSPAVRWTTAIGAVASVGIIVWLLFVSRWYSIVVLGFALVVVSVIALFKGVEARKFKIGGESSTQAQTNGASAGHKLKAALSTEGQPAVFLLVGLIVIGVGFGLVYNDLKPAASAPARRAFPDMPAPASVPRVATGAAGEITTVPSTNGPDPATSPLTTLLSTTSPWRTDPEQPIEATVESCSRVPELEGRVSCRLLLVNDTDFAYGLDAENCKAVDDVGNSYDTDSAHSSVSWEESGKPVPSTSLPLAPGTEHPIQVVLTQPLSTSATVIQLRMSLRYQANSYFVPVWVDVAVAGVT